MNNNMKKIVASIVLGTFTVGMTTPAYAAVETTEVVAASLETVQVIGQSELGIGSDDVAPYSIPSKIAKELAEKLVKNWDKVVNVFVDLGADEQLLKDINKVKKGLLALLNEYNGVLDTAEDILAEALVSVGVNESFASLLAKGIIKVLL